MKSVLPSTLDVGKSDDFLATARKLDAKEAQNAIEGSGVAPVGALPLVWTFFWLRGGRGGTQ